MLNLSRFLCVGSLLTATLPAWASSSEWPTGWQTTFARAEAAILSGDKTAYANAREALPGHPLLPVLQALHLEERLADAAPDTLAATLEKEGRAPHAERLRTAWLRRLARQGQHTLFRQHYQSGLDVVLDCLHWRLRLEANPQDADANDAFAKLWLRPEPLPRDCRATETVWAAAGQRSEERIWTRIERVLDDGPAGELKTLKALLPKNERSLVDLWQRLLKKPAEISKPELRQDSRPNAWRPKLAALEALIWADRDEGLQKLAPVQNDLSLPPEARIRLSRSIALALATAGHPQAPAFLAQVPESARDERLLGVHLIDLLHRRDWAAFDAIWAGLAAAQQQEPRWQYWRARAEGTQGRTDAAQTRWQALAKNANYYGFLARAQLGDALIAANQTTTSQTSTHQTAASTPTSDDLRALRDMPAIQRVEAWLALKRDTQARRDWAFAVGQLAPEQHKLAARLALELGWPDRAIVLANRVAADDWTLRFPMPNQALVQSESQHRKVDMAWAFAITRQESLFQPAVLSSAGAHGLMQLMPPTAKLLARRYHIPYKDSRQLLTAPTNIRLGVAMLGDLARRNDDNFVYATAAYNAGQSRVDRWHRQFGHLPLDLWIEAIPYRETQQYVKNVMAFSLVYAQLLGQDAVVFQHLAERARHWPAPEKNGS